MHFLIPELDKKEGWSPSAAFSGNTWENAESFTYPVFVICPSGVLWVMMALDIGESLMYSRGSLTFT